MLLSTTLSYFFCMNVAFNRASTLFLKIVILCMGMLVLALCVFAFPAIWREAQQGLPDYTYVWYPGLLGIFATVIPFLCALYQGWKLLQYIDRNEAFSEGSVQALRIIMFSAIAMFLLYAVGMPLAYLVAELDDAPGLILVAAAFTCAPLVVATFAAVLKKLVQSAIAMKLDQDLTI
jgi:hypothetical protein